MCIYCLSILKLPGSRCWPQHVRCGMRKSDKTLILGLLLLMNPEGSEKVVVIFVAVMDQSWLSVESIRCWPKAYILVFCRSSPKELSTLTSVSDSETRIFPTRKPDRTPLVWRTVVRSAAFRCLVVVGCYENVTLRKEELVTGKEFSFGGSRVLDEIMTSR